MRAPSSSHDRRPSNAACLGRLKRLASLVAAAGVLALPQAAYAQLAVSHSPSTAPILGTAIRGTSATTFSVSTGGAVTRTSGDAIRLTGGGVTPPSITISCGLLNLSSLCAARQVRVTIQPASAGVASISRFRVSGLTGATYKSGSAPAENSTITFDLNALGLFGTAQFTLGMDVLVAAAAASGAKTFDYTVTATFL